MLELIRTVICLQVVAKAGACRVSGDINRRRLPECPSISWQQYVLEMHSDAQMPLAQFFAYVLH